MSLYKLNCMDRPFKYIFDSSPYTLKYAGYGWRGTENDSIDKCITDTATHYDQTQITPDIFKRMIDKITQGATSSPIAQRNCVDVVVQAICIYYPVYLNQTIVTNLIKCFKATNTLAVEYIESTGYKFTSSQYKALNKVGIMMLDKMESLTLSEFYSLFSNDSFKNKLNTKWDVNPDLYEISVIDESKKVSTETKQVIVKTKNNDNEDDEDDEDDNEDNVTANLNANIGQTKHKYDQYLVLHKIIKQYNIELDDEFWQHIISLALTQSQRYTYSKPYITIYTLLNIHRVVNALGCKAKKSLLDNIIKTYEIKKSDENTEAHFNEVLSFYDNISFDRADIMGYALESIGLTYDNVTMILRSKYCSYDPMMDLYFWMNTSASYMRSYLLGRVMEIRDQELYMHLVSLYHVKFSDFKNYIDENPGCGWDNEQFIQIALSFHQTSDMIEYYVDNKLIVGLDILDYCRDINIVKNTYKACTSYDEQGYNRILDLMYEKKLSSAIKYHYVDDRYSLYRVLRSFSPRDRRIMSHNQMERINKIDVILRYDIHVTKEHLEFLLSSGCEELVIRLLHTSKKYYYLIDMIDLEMILKCYNYLPRMWFYRNIVIPKTVDGLQSSDFEFCLNRNSERFLFNVKMNEKENEDLPVTVIDKTDEIAAQYRADIQMVQEEALDRIINGNN